MKKHFRAALVLPLVALWPAACTVDKTEDGEMPDVEVEGGRLPAYDVDPANVQINADTKKVVVPDVDITRDTSRDTTSRNN